MKKYRAVYTVDGWCIEKRWFLFFWKTMMYGRSEDYVTKLLHELKTKKPKY
jgi:hypothetical protein